MVQTSGTALSSGQRTQYAVPATPCRGGLLDRALVRVLTALLRITAPGGPARRLPARRPWRALVRRSRLEGRALSVVAGPLTGDDQGLHGPGPGVY